VTPEAFATNRGARLDEVDKELLPVVKKALTHWSAKTDWYEDIVEGASVLWQEMFEQSVPDADPKQRDKLLAAFQNDLRKTLAKTQDPAVANSDQANVITEWVSTSTSNHAELRAARVNKHPALRWVTRHDDRVRALHREMDGVTEPAGSMFKVGDVLMSYPGEPVGDPANWIRCRCLLQRVGEGKSMAGNLTAFTEAPTLVAAAPPADLDETPVDMPQPTPFHGVAAPTDTPSGDGRQLSSTGFSNRSLPLPFAYQKGGFHGGDPGPSVTVGRIDSVQLDDATGLVHFAGQFSPNIPEADEAIQHVVDGTMRGVSIDLGAMVVEQPDFDDPSVMAALEDGTHVSIFSQWEIAGITMVMVPAFAQAFVALGPAEDDPNPLVDDGSESGDESDAVDDAPDFADTSMKGRKKSADAGHAMDDGSFPIENVQDLKNAIQAIGRAKDPAKAKAHIKKRANDLGQPDLIPENWSTQVAFGVTSNPSTEDGPGWLTDPKDTQRLRSYWTHGEGAAKIAWGTDGDFDRCRSHLGKYVEPQYLAGTCSNLHKVATGAWPGHAPGESLVAAAARLWDTVFYGKTEGAARGAVLAEGGPEGLDRVLALVGHADRPEGESATGRSVRASLESRRPSSISASSGVGIVDRANTGRHDAGSFVSTAPVLQPGAPGASGSAGEHTETMGFSRSEVAVSAGARENGQDVEGVRALLGMSFARTAPSVNLVASAAPDIPPGDWFQDPKLSALTPFTVMDDGRVFGHVAGWSVCHIGFDKVCTTAPTSQSGYAYYRTGEVETTLGRVPVGQITMGAGHANMRADAATAAAHYDNVAHAVADVAAGEDQHGIWVAGALRPGLHEDDVRALRAASLSGDWRRIRGSMEMVAALAVNVPGFPIPRNALAASGQDQLSLVAAGVVQEESQAPTEDFDGRVALAVQRVLARRERVVAAKAKAAEASRRVRLAQARRIG
jgi:hypothetical protein